MGVQGVFRDAKGRKYWERLPPIRRQGLEFEFAAARSNQFVWLFARYLDNRKRQFSVRVNRQTGEIVPL